MQILYATATLTVLNLRALKYKNLVQSTRACPLNILCILLFGVTQLSMGCMAFTDDCIPADIAAC